MPEKLVPTFEDERCRVVRAADPHGRILGFLDRIASVINNDISKAILFNINLSAAEKKYFTIVFGRYYINESVRI
jgi:hypothetical protein